MYFSMRNRRCSVVACKAIEMYYSQCVRIGSSENVYFYIICQDKLVREAHVTYSGSTSPLMIYFEIPNRKHTGKILLTKHLSLRLTDCLLRSSPSNCPVCWRCVHRGSRCRLSRCCLVLWGQLCHRLSGAADLHGVQGEKMIASLSRGSLLDEVLHGGSNEVNVSQEWCWTRCCRPHVGVCVQV